MSQENVEIAKRALDAFNERDLGDTVLALGRIEGRGRSSGVQLDAPMGFTTEFRGGKIWRSRTYLDPDDALRAAGLPADS